MLVDIHFLLKWKNINPAGCGGRVAKGSEPQLIKINNERPHENIAYTQQFGDSTAAWGRSPGTQRHIIWIIN